ncbi:hypothetical protein SAMN05216203_3488 [Marinobacter daqiaonensis]|uniref:CDP-Glycerol:Poly(Glycerophosphate) glycerophosphotransferase n=1 Tax=Marinobacter daqiaonensis TaxID=650891 RepID=A0A1I6K298_9GAMM|nr:hypothetical protein [Marinobacter daqiaonensis]SFR85372.1 hypothetical protein SAMN05216203_3488 [Marinobacter daqiaonensis]
MNWHRHLEAILKQEPETWLDYQAGARLHRPPVRKGTSPFHLSHVAFWFRALAYFFYLAGKISPKETLTAGNKRSVRFLALALSRNQMEALSGTLDALRSREQSVLAIAKHKRLRNPADRKRYQPLRYSLMDILRASQGFVHFGRSLSGSLRSRNPAAGPALLPEVAKVYLYLAYFYRIIRKTEPECVITSNDHSAMNRCMLAVARQLGVKTAYLQHASVSPAFPALTFDFAFLDGPIAAETYRQCEENRPPGLEGLSAPCIIYSGQKKHLSGRAAPDSETIGIAINKLDRIEPVASLISLIASEGKDVSLRWHPRQSRRDVATLKKTLGGRQKVHFSDPASESVDSFLGKLKYLIAGNSSIHLEAAIKGITPFYYEFSATDKPDYYGYVRQGLAVQASSEAELIALLTSPRPPELDPEAVRQYSATFATEWEGREGELVAECLLSAGATRSKRIPNEFKASQASDY